MEKDFHLFVRNQHSEADGNPVPQKGPSPPARCNVLSRIPQEGSCSPFATLLRFREKEARSPVWRSFLARIRYDSLDTLDKWSVLIITLTIIYAAGLLAAANGQSQAGEDDLRRQTVSVLVLNPELDNKIQLAMDLLVRENLDKTEMLVASLLGEFPYEGRLHMLKGDILVRRQQPIAAMYAYKEAVELNPDFLDRKTDLFQGKKIKVTVEEALAEIEAGLGGGQNDIGMKDHLQTVYFMKRKLAGGCG